jgi:hypothetical protein
MRKRALVKLWICFAKAKENRELHNAFLTEKAVFPHDLNGFEQNLKTVL